MELGLRKQQILAAIVDAYIRTGEPIGSKALVERLDRAVSSATIRNDMAELAMLGFLEQPHTSAGRLPTSKAFRLYLDGMTALPPLSAESRRRVDALLEPVSGDPERLLSQASDLLAETTGVAVAVAIPSRQTEALRRVELLPTGPQAVALLLLTDSGALRSRVCRLDMPGTPEELQAVAELLNRTFGGKALASVTAATVQALLAQLECGLHMVPLLTAFLELAQESTAGEIRLTGQLNLLRHPDYQPERARALLMFLSHREQLAGMLTEHPAGLRVMLGSESLRPELEGSSIIVTRYVTGTGGDGSFCLIGPVRMDYATAIPRLQYVAGTVGRMLRRLCGEGESE